MGDGKDRNGETSKRGTIVRKEIVLLPTYASLIALGMYEYCSPIPTSYTVQYTSTTPPSTYGIKKEGKLKIDN